MYKREFNHIERRGHPFRWNHRALDGQDELWSRPAVEAPV